MIDIENDTGEITTGKLTGKTWCQKLFFTEVTGCWTATLLKRTGGTGAFLWILQSFSEHLKVTVAEPF